MHTQSLSQLDLTVLLNHYQSARYEDAYELAISITKRYPDHPFAWKILGAILIVRGDATGALFANEMVVKLNPSDPEALYNLSNTLKMLGKLEDAEIGYKNSIAIRPDFPEAYLNLGLTLHELGRPIDAELSYKNALAFRPEFIQALNNLGNIQRELGNYEDAVAQYQKAIKIAPNYAEAHNNLGVTLQIIKRLNEAEESYKRAIASRLDFAEAHFNLGTLFYELTRFADAEISYRHALRLKPDYAEAYYNLGLTLLETGDPIAALEVLADLIRIHPTRHAKSLFVDALKNIKPTNWDTELSTMVTSALLEPWGRVSDIGNFAFQLLKLDPAFKKSLHKSQQGAFEDSDEFDFPKKDFLSSSLLNAILISGPIADRELEQYFAKLRYNFLKIANTLDTTQILVDAENFSCALAQQCFVNEYVYYQTPEETKLSIVARDHLAKALAENQKIPAALVLSVACYYPLHSLDKSEALLEQTYSKEMASVLKQQIQEPLEEFALKAYIPTLTGMDSQVSLAVQNQYEENPYPRWVRIPATSNSQNYNSFISKKFSLADFTPLTNDQNLEVLVAGCGTGQHSINCSQIIKGSKILAIDLSMASLAFAKRKTIEMGIDAIDYAQADLLQLASTGRVFDVIESVGVLHHLDKPFEGWETLVSMLKPRGLMRLGFYSELARKDIVKVRNLIDKEGIGSSIWDIRNYRHHLLGLSNYKDFMFATSGVDFYSMSACRDLIFHVQEHRMQLDMIAKFLEKHQLQFLGFDIDRSIIQSYKLRFPDDPAATNLTSWHIYEEENPHTFNSMYQFLVQKK